MERCINLDVSDGTVRITLDTADEELGDHSGNRGKSPELDDEKVKTPERIGDGR